MFDLKDIFCQFRTEGIYVKAKELSSGHINDTFLVETSGKPFYVLQRINHFVFKDTERLIENKFIVSQYLQKKLSHLPKEELRKRVLILVETKSQKHFYKDPSGNYWNLMFYIEDCISYEKVPNQQIAFETGKIFGEFLHLTKDFDSTKLFEILPNFHTMSVRLKQFDDSLKTASNKRKTESEELLSFIDQRREEMQKIERLFNEKKIPIRLTHNDTKISNVLFSQKEKALCVIDTDTVMPGIIHYDFGDAVRTICNTAFEDEKDLSKVTFNFDFYKAFVKGFLGSPLKSAISQIEIDNLAFSAKMITFIMGLRMLTDFLNNDVYYKTNYEIHNLDRAKNQFKLVAEMDKGFEKMDETIQEEFNRHLSNIITSDSFL